MEIVTSHADSFARVVIEKVRTEAMGESDLEVRVVKGLRPANALCNDIALEGSVLSEREIDGERYGLTIARPVASVH